MFLIQEKISQNVIKANLSRIQLCHVKNNLHFCGAILTSRNRPHNDPH